MASLDNAAVGISQWDDLASAAGSTCRARPSTRASRSYCVCSSSKASVVVTELPSQMRVSLGCDCAGLCTPIHALSAAGYEVQLAFACDISARAKAYCLEVHKPDLWLDDVMHRDVHSMPRVDIYTAGFPCQPFSSLGLRAGVHDSRGTVFGGCLAYSEHHLPSALILENVKGLLTIDGGKVFLDIIERMSKVGGKAYDVAHSVTNSEFHGSPQHIREFFWSEGWRRQGT